jgi:hypothetical protein
MLFRDAAHLCFFEGEIPTRLNIKFASKYWKLRESKTHDETLQATLGENCPTIAEADLRRLGAIRLVPAKAIRERLHQRAREFHPLQLREYKDDKRRKMFRDTLRYVASIDGLDYNLWFEADNRETGGLECEIRIYPSGTKGLEGIGIRVAQPAWDIITPESIESDLNYLVRRIRIRLDAVLPPAIRT